uniref:Uncharacterized protein n=1 Tax=Anguilla anguilla TaxID=7936 RepID=A0A0E9SP80_ANGAN
MLTLRFQIKSKTDAAHIIGRAELIEPIN